MSNKRFFNSVIIGVVLAVLEGVLIKIGDPEASKLVLLQSVIFWFSVGVIIYISNSGLSTYFHSVFITLFLNIPWYINLTIIPKELGHLPPMIFVSIIFGLIAGFLTTKLNNRVEN